MQWLTKYINKECHAHSDMYSMKYGYIIQQLLFNIENRMCPFHQQMGILQHMQQSHVQHCSNYTHVYALLPSNPFMHSFNLRMHATMTKLLA